MVSTTALWELMEGQADATALRELLEGLADSTSVFYGALVGTTGAWGDAIEKKESSAQV